MSCCGKDNNNRSADYKYIGVNGDEPRKHVERFKGPIDKRSCTDILCLLIFLVFIFATVLVGAWAVYFGDIQKIVKPTNSKGEICGLSPNVLNKTKLVFFNILTCAKMGPAVFMFGCPTNQICVEKCPTEFWMREMTDKRQNMVCVGDVSAAKNTPYQDQSISDLISNRICAEFVFPSIDASGRCLPDFTKVVKALSAVKDQKINNETIINGLTEYQKVFGIADVSTKIIHDVVKSYHFIAIGLGVSLLLSLIYLLLLRYFAAFMVYLTITLFVLVFAAATVLCFLTWYILKENTKKIENVDFSWLTTTNYSNKDFWLWTGIVVGVFLILIIVILIFLRTRIKIAVGILRMTSKSLVYMIELIFWPIVFFILQIVVILVFLWLFIQISSVRTSIGVAGNMTRMNIEQMNQSEIEKTIGHYLDKLPCNPQANDTANKFCIFVKYGTKTYVWALLVFAVFMFLWIVGFIKALSQMTIAGAFASYYFAFSKPSDIPTMPVLTSLWRSLRYHTGSLAFGSFILALVQLIRIIFEYLREKANNSQNVLAEFIGKCFSCCLYCLEKFIKFLNKNAYIMIAIYGQSFCSAAKNAFNLLLRNCLRVFVLDKVTDFVLFLGKLVIMGIVGGLSFLFFNKMALKEFTPKLYFYYVPIIIIVIGSYFISSIFFTVYETGTDTILLCFCEDLERNDGSPDKPYFMSKELRNVLHKKNQPDMKLEEIEPKQ